MDYFDRPALKQETKRLMRQASPNIYLVSLLFLALSNLPTIIMQRDLYPALLNSGGSWDQMMEIYQSWSLNNSGTALTVASYVMQVFLLFVGFGYTLYCLYVSRSEENGGFSTLFSGFSQFWRVMCVAILQYVFVFLWSLLFIVPGIIKGMAYSQAYRIMMDNPDMSALDCITASKELMQGHKWDYFVLQLSFLGWSIVAAFTFGILLIWLQPYIETSNAGFYNDLCGWTPEAEEPEDAPAPDDRPSVDDYWKN